ncbi:MAG: L,D-transpeptidase, partial [Pedobacter sp.]
MKKNLLFIVICLFFASCGWFDNTPEIGKVLAEHFDNKLYKNFDTVAYDRVFSKKLDELGKDLSNPKLTTAYYLDNKNKPLLVTKFFVNGGLDTLNQYLENSKADGFNPEVFYKSEISKLLSTLKANDFKKIDDVYPVIAELELKSADALLRYTNYMQFGSVNPRKIFNRYYIALKRPDSVKMDSVLKTDNLVKTLAGVQPKAKSYIDLKNALANYRETIGNENDEAIKKIKLNLERLRWKMPIETDEVVQVNIPDFSLTWFKNNDTLTHMNVCVGGKREATYAEKMKRFAKSGSL